MSHSDAAKNKQPRMIRVLFENSLFLIGGAVAALFWANAYPGSYQHFVNFDLTAMFVDVEHGPGHDGDAHSEPEGPSEGDHQSAEGAAGSSAAAGAPAHHGFSIHFFVNDLLMALFFAIAGKEVFESLLPGGVLSNPRKAATPLMATLGGIVGPVVVYLTIVAIARRGDLARGWAVPCATDIAFSYLVARIVFGNGHPAIAFLLLLAIADDAAGLVILAIAYPNPAKPMEPSWLLMTVAAMGLAVLLRRLRRHSFWWYLLLPGSISWLSFYWAGLHPALGLVPIVFCMPSAHSDLGIFAREELNRHDTLNEFEHWWKNPVEVILGLFGLTNAGVEFGAVGVGTWAVLLGLLLGKPLGITLFTYLSERLFKLEVPAGMNYRQILTLGMIAAIGFTVALFMSTAAFPPVVAPKAVQDSVKMGALLSLVAGVASLLIARVLGVRPLRSSSSAQEAADKATGQEPDGDEPAATIATQS